MDSEVSRPTNQFATQVDLSALHIGSSTTHEFPVVTTDKGPLTSAAADSVGAVFLGGVPDWTRTNRIQLLLADTLEPHPLNPRRVTSREALLTLAESVRESGLRKPLDICQFDAETPGRALLLSGHRRLWTSNMLGCALIPCRLDPRGVLTEVEQREALIRYNEGQERPAPIDRAQSILDMMVASQFSQAQTAVRIGLSPAMVGRILKLLSLEEKVQEMVNAGELSETVGFELTRVKDNPQRQVDLALEAKERKYSAAKVRRMVGQPRAKIIHRRRVPDAPAEPNERRILLDDSGTSIILKSSKVMISDSAVQEAIRELVDRVPVDLTVTSEGPGTGSSIKLATPVEPSGIDSRQGGGELDASADSNRAAHVSNKAGGAENVVPGDTDTAAPQASLAQSLEDPFGLRQPAAYTFPVVRGFTSAAAASVDAMFSGGYPDWSRSDQVQLVFRSALVPHPWNPRKRVPTEAMRETVLAIKQSGIHTPLDISKHPDDPQKAFILGGHRRTWAAHKLSLDLVPVKLDPRGVLNEVQVRERLINDNEGQVKPAPINRARSFAVFLAVAGIPVAEAARRINVSEVAFKKAISLLDLPAPVQTLINNGDLPESIGRALLEHRGGEQAIVALAHKVLANNIPVGTVQRIVRRSQIDLNGLAAEAQPAAKEMHSLVGGNNRIHVVLTAAGEQLPEGESFVSLLRSGLTRLGTDADSLVSGNQSSVIETKSVPTTLLASCAATDPQGFVKGIRKYLPEAIEVRDEEMYVRAEYEAALKLRFNNAELKKLGFTSEEVTQHYTERWHGKPRRNNADDTVTVAEVTEYLLCSLSHLETFPASRVVLSEIEVNKLNLDTEHYAGGSRKIIEQELRERAEKLADIFTVRLLPLVNLEHIEKSITGVSGADRHYTKEELQGAGVTLPSNFDWYYRRWLADTTRIPYAGQISDRGLRFDDLHAYFTHCTREILWATGGRAERNIGKKQLREANIVYSAAAGSDASKHFSARAVFEEIRSSLENLNTLFSESQ